MDASLYHRLATSDRAFPRFLRRLYHAREHISLPVPRFVGKLMLYGMLVVRGMYYFLKRSLICEPIFKAYCSRYGRNLHTGTFVHWVQGKGNIEIGDNVWINGKCSFAFGHRYTERPTIEIGDGTGIGNGCAFVAGKRITIGRNCMLSGSVTVFDSNAHPTDPLARRQGRAAAAEDVREVVIGDDVWIGARCLIFPGVRIGRGSVVSAGSVVRHHVPPYSVAAGNPARVMFRLEPPEPGTLEQLPDKRWY
ncbi:MAG: acyltransferase [Lentisphaerae bacterium]|nr:acyltransferase [Lentisphaerota bacterium]